VACRDDVSPFEGEDRLPSSNPAVTRLTASPGDDRTPAWSAGSDSVYYSAQNPSILPGQPGVLMTVPREGGPSATTLRNVQTSGSTARWLVSPATFAAAERIAYAEIGPLWEPGLPVCEILQPGGLNCEGPVTHTVPPLKHVHMRVRDLHATGPIEDDPAFLVALSGVSQGSPSLPRMYVVHDYPFQQLFRDERALVFGPSWSPDGQRIVFSDGLQLFIWTVGADVAEPVPGTEDALAPAWSPDEERIAFFRVERAGSISGSCVRIAFGDVVCEMERTIYTLGRRVLALIRPDGSGLTELGEGEDPAWSTDGTTLLFRRDGQIWQSNPDGSDAVQIPFTEDGREPSLSPDGRHLAFSKLTSRGDYDIWVIDLDTLP
jgi:Tol biopolymer transport system component